jgi:hypothetical protein
LHRVAPVDHYWVFRAGHLCPIPPDFPVDFPAGRRLDWAK